MYVFYITYVKMSVNPYVLCMTVSPSGNDCHMDYVSISPRPGIHYQRTICDLIIINPDSDYPYVLYVNCITASDIDYPYVLCSGYVTASDSPVSVCDCITPHPRPLVIIHAYYMVG
jgi:hypothetical protein